MISEEMLRLFRKSHRNIGIVLAIFLLLVTVTGILLNHTQGLALDQHPVPAFIATRYYSDQEITGFEIERHYYYTMGQVLYFDARDIAQCEDLGGATRVDGQVVILCDGGFFLFNDQHELIERMGAAFGFPENLSRIATYEGQLLVGNAQETFSFDTESLLVKPVSNLSVDWPRAVRVPDNLMLGESISWEQFILDLHSGMFLGNSGKWLVDVVAIFVLVMTFSGLVIWRNQR